MATSDYHHISDVLHVVEQIKPRSILDVGIGFGIWGVLCREVLDLYYGRHTPDEWVTKIEGVEIFEGYRNPLWGWAYDEIFIGNALQILDKLGHYDLILACDVIEHFKKEQGRILVEKMVQHADVVIITSPRGFIQPGSTWGNKYDSHSSLWSENDFQDIPHLYKNIGFTFMVVLASGEQRLKSINILRPLDVSGVKNGMVELIRLTFKRINFKIKNLFANRV
jgi:hypothetical protein